MFFSRSFSTLLLALSATAVLAQVYDPTMDGGYIRTGNPWDAYYLGFGPRNLVPNGSFNYLLDPCDGTYEEGGGWYYPQGRWFGTQWNSSTPASMIAPGTDWPYNIHFYCDFNEINFSHPARYQGFIGGYLQAKLIDWDTQGEQRNYLLVTLAEPMAPGVEYAFSMQVTMAFRGTATNPTGPDPMFIPAVDRIGAVLLNELPDTLELGQVLDGLVPFVETPTGDPVEVSDVLTLQDTVVGAGQRYLVVGIFSPLEDLTYNPTPSAQSWSTTYMFDNFKLYRAHCDGANGLFAQEVLPGCAGTTVEVAPLFGEQPFQWNVDGTDLASAPSIQVPVPLQDSTVVRLVTGTGQCTDTSYLYVRPRHLVVAPMDTAFFCDDPMELAPNTTYMDVDDADVDARWTQVGGALDEPVHYWDMAITLSTPGTYVLHTTYNDCPEQTDTAFVHPSPTLVDAEGRPLLLPEARPEHCVHMNDGAIIVHDMGLGGQPAYSWYEPPLPGTTDSLLQLGAGLYRVRVWNGLQCETWALTVDLMLDSCAAVDGSVRASVDADCGTPDDDAPLDLQPVVAMPSGNVGITDANGHYDLFVPPGASTLQHTPTDHWTGNLCGDGTVVALPMAGAQAAVQFVDTVHIPIVDLAITGVHGNTWVIGNAGWLAVVVRNVGELPAEAVLRILLTPDLTTVLTDPEYMGLAGDTLLFDLGVLAPGEQRTKTIPVYVPVNTALIGTAAHLHAQVQPVVDEALVANNDHTLDFDIRGAYDPNDKQVSPLGLTEAGYTPVSERVFTYTVRFQNTGNHPAARVHVTDTLHTLLDASSLRLLYHSHPVQAFVHEGVLHLDHQGIMLPDSASDPEGSQGMVVFSLRARPQAGDGDRITNTANIFFDSNPPIVTNTVQNLYGIDHTGIEAVAATATLAVRPLADGMYAYALSGAQGVPATLRLLDAQGRSVRALRPARTGTFTLQDLPPGMYLLVATTTGQRLATRFVHLP